MRNCIILALAVLLCGCQSPKHSENPPSNSQTNPNRSQGKSSLYDRYKYKNNRYTISQDSAPKNPKTANFKEPKPTKEPLSRYGNPSEYYVDGRTYEVMKNSSGYKSRGVASWYGMKFHKQRTSSGEPYNMYVMTAAHKTLPLPTYIKVRNLENGKEAIVKVNDRGPFHSNRIIDLSYAAALKLGIFPKGTAQVEIETLMGPASKGLYFLQAGAFTTEYSAKLLKSKLNRITPSPVIIEHYNDHYVVRVGPFGNKNMADNLKLKLANNGIKGSFSVLI
ncbi:septal ring lytic transglycosylase RlpA family protein [Legionella waltersii]|nr:septal ring lytic transglycosylase RlpA family protein [Legionella waltersii]